MDRRVEVTAARELAARSALPGVREVAGERVVAQVLRGGALASGTLFFASLLFEALPPGRSTAALVSATRKAALAALVVTPLLRLVAAGLLLGLRGEQRYAVYAAATAVVVALGLFAGVGL